MRRLILAGAILLVCASIAAAQVREEWIARHNGPANGDDGARAIALDAAGNVYVTGRSQGEGTGLDFLTIKYDAESNELWVARYNGPGNSIDEAVGIGLDAAGNVYVAGRSVGEDTATDYATIKYDPDGNELWVARYNGTANGHDVCVGVAVDRDGNVYVTGYTSSLASGSADFATVKYDTDGNEVWVDLYNGPDSRSDLPVGIGVDGAGNVAVAGTSNTSGQWQDHVIIKYSPDGNRLWLLRSGNPTFRINPATALVVDAEGNVYVTGWTRRTTGMPREYWHTTKYSPAGSGVWGASEQFGLSLPHRTYAINVDSQRNVYVLGNTAALVKYTPSGVRSWVAAFNPGPPGFGFAQTLTADAQGNVYVVGSYAPNPISGSDYATVKFDSEGRRLWVAVYNGTGSASDSASGVALDGDGNVYVTGGSGGYKSGADFVTIKYRQK